jgi:hypothetical protein
MADINEIIHKIPKPMLVIVVLILALGFIVYTNPMQDGCDVQIANFGRTTRGILAGFKTKKNLTQFAQIENFKNLCREGNSQGSCENYYDALKKITTGLKAVEDKCQPKLMENYENLIKVISNAIQIMALNAWGDASPEGVGERMGWLSEPDIYTFCRLKTQLIRLSSDDEFKLLRAKTYAEFPDSWPASVPLDQRLELPRPRVLKSDSNPTGSLSSEEIFKRSLFSLRCDLYL